MAEVDDVISYRVSAPPDAITASWEARIASANRFLTRSLTERKTINAGLLEADDTPDIAALVDSGVVREWAMEALPDQVTLTLRGFDAAKLVLEKRIRRLYRRSLAGVVDTGGILIGVPGRDLTTPERTLPVATRPDILSQATPASGELPVSEGHWSARSIAEDICLRKGIQLAWQAPDYEQLTDFTASGRVVDVIQQLLAPFSQNPGPKKIDVFYVGRQLIVRQRGQGGEQLWETSVDDAALVSLTLTARPTFPDGTPGLVIVRGRNEGGVTFTPGSTEEEIVADTVDATITARYREPDHSLISMITVYKFAAGAPAPTGSTEVILRKEVVNEFEAALYSGSRAVNQPLLLSTEARVFGLRGDASGTIQLARDREDYYHDAEGFLVATRTFSQRYRPASGSTSAGLRDDSLRLQTLVDAGPQVWMDTTASYALGPSSRLLVPASGSLRDWRIASDAVRRVEQLRVISGYRPEGPGRRNPSAVGAHGAPLTIVQTIPGGDADYAIEINGAPHLDRVNAQAIADAYVSAAATPWEIEIAFGGLAVPWLQKGSKMRLTGVTTEDGTPIPLPDAVITELEFDDNGEAAVMRGRALCWAA